jgi:hypothetical protein
MVIFTLIFTYFTSILLITILLFLIAVVYDESVSKEKKDKIQQRAAVLMIIFAPITITVLIVYGICALFTGLYRSVVYNSWSSK